MKYKAAIFDMDGTILDTSEDLVNAINYAMEQCGHRHDFTKEDGCTFFGSGVDVAIQRALAKEANLDRETMLKIGTREMPFLPGLDMEEHKKLKNYYMPYYKEHNAVKTGPFPGVPEMLSALRQNGVKTAVVSNKPHDSVVELADKYFEGLFDFSLGETAGIPRKPAPDMNNLILEKLGVKACQAVYLGDTEIDLATAKGSDMDCICVDWGFRSKDELEKMGARIVVSDATDICRIICEKEQNDEL